MAFIIHVGVAPRKWFPSCAQGPRGRQGCAYACRLLLDSTSDPELLNICKYVQKWSRVLPSMTLKSPRLSCPLCEVCFVGQIPCLVVFIILMLSFKSSTLNITIFLIVHSCFEGRVFVVQLYLVILCRCQSGLLSYPLVTHSSVQIHQLVLDTFLFCQLCVVADAERVPAGLIFT